MTPPRGRRLPWTATAPGRQRWCGSIGSDPNRLRCRRAGARKRRLPRRRRAFRSRCRWMSPPRRRRRKGRCRRQESRGAAAHGGTRNKRGNPSPTPTTFGAAPRSCRPRNRNRSPSRRLLCRRSPRSSHTARFPRTTTRATFRPGRPAGRSSCAALPGRLGRWPWRASSRCSPGTSTSRARSRRSIPSATTTRSSPARWWPPTAPWSASSTGNAARW